MIQITNTHGTVHNIDPKRVSYYTSTITEDSALDPRIDLIVDGAHLSIWFKTDLEANKLWKKLNLAKGKSNL